MSNRRRILAGAALVGLAVASSTDQQRAAASAWFSRHRWTLWAIAAASWGMLIWGLFFYD